MEQAAPVSSPTAAQHHPHKPLRAHPRGLRVIGIYRLAKAALLLVLAVYLYTAIERGPATVFREWVDSLHLNPEMHIVQATQEHLEHINERTFVWAEVIILVYAILYTVEGVGLLMEKKWAEWLTLVSGALLIPLEVYKLIRHPSALILCTLIANLAIVAYLVWLLRRQAEARKESAQTSG